MIVEFHAADRMFALKALGIYAKGIDAAKTASDKVYVPTLELQTAEATALGVEEWVTASLDEMGAGEVRDVEISIPLALALRTACSVYLGQLTKLTEKQADLLVPIEDTNVLMSHLQSLADRLSGQTELAGMTRFPDATASFNGGPMTTMEDAARQAAEHLAGVLRENGTHAKAKATQRHAVAERGDD